jgi:hypothetical protein
VCRNIVVSGPQHQFLPSGLSRFQALSQKLDQLEEGRTPAKSSYVVRCAVYQPDESRHVLQVHARYRELYAALKPLFSKL